MYGLTQQHALEVEVGSVEVDGWLRGVAHEEEGVREVEGRDGEPPQTLTQFKRCRVILKDDLNK